jgi:hypothetical protein
MVRSRLSLVLLGKLSLRVAAGASMAVTAEGTPPSSKLYTLYYHVHPAEKLDNSLRQI